MKCLSKEQQANADLVLVPLQYNGKSHGNGGQISGHQDVDCSLLCHEIKFAMSAQLTELLDKSARPAQGHGAKQLLQLDLEEDAVISFLQNAYTGSLGDPSLLSKKGVSQLRRFSRKNQLPGTSTPSLIFIVAGWSLKLINNINCFA